MKTTALGRDLLYRRVFVPIIVVLFRFLQSKPPLPIIVMFIFNIVFSSDKVRQSIRH